MTARDTRPGANDARTRPWTRRWLRDPLLHFLLIGIALFAAYRMLNPPADRPDQMDRIELTQDDLRQMAVAWIAQGRPSPSAEQMAGLVAAKVREEVLYREALALGLDKDDTIVKRRLAQKMDFLAEDAAALREPDRQEIEAWFRARSNAFASPPRASFTHIYFSFDRRGESALAEAAKALATIKDEPRDSPAATKLGDPFMFQDYYGNRSPTQLATQFGPGFAKALFQAQPRSWKGPIESGYGWHLVFVDAITPVRVPAFEEVEADVRTEWIAEQRARSKEKAFEAMRARYTIVLPGADGGLPATANPPTDR
jgi:peptidyl-prolyl cis-trans isomerase C